MPAGGGHVVREDHSSSGRPLDAHDVHDRLVWLLRQPQTRSAACGHRVPGGQHRAEAGRRGVGDAGQRWQPHRPHRRLPGRHGDDQPLRAPGEGETHRLSWQPVAPDGLAPRLAAWVAATSGVVRLAIDGAPGTEPDALGQQLVPVLEAAGRPVEHVRGTLFWRDASLRLEYGREDVESYLTW